ncbi:MAG: hypothetical protein MHM6MM_007267 [Cercozoa sp. M6MM]
MDPQSGTALHKLVLLLLIVTVVFLVTQVLYVPQTFASLVVNSSATDDACPAEETSRSSPPATFKQIEGNPGTHGEARVKQVHDRLDRMLEKVLHMKRGQRIRDGHTALIPKKTRCIEALSSIPSTKVVYEIGFNAGHSTASFLGSRPDSMMLSFDICNDGGGRGHPEYHSHSAAVIRDEFGTSRWSILCGDSKVSLPALAEYSPKLLRSVDLFSIDGRHDYEYVHADTKNAAVFVKDGGLMLFDDCEWDHTHKGIVEAFKTLENDGVLKATEVTEELCGLKRVEQQMCVYRVTHLA